MDRRRFLVLAGGSAALGGVALSGSALIDRAAAATEDELAYANFAVAAELLLADFYERASRAKTFPAPNRAVIHSGRAAARQHAAALSDLLVGAGDTAPAPEDFEFAWPKETFADEGVARKTALGVLRALGGAYQSALATVSTPSYRVLYASLAASVGQQLGALRAKAGLEPFPAALDLEAASTALEAYLG